MNVERRKLEESVLKILSVFGFALQLESKNVQILDKKNRNLETRFSWNFNFILISLFHS